MSVLMGEHWLPILDGDDRARALQRRHYSRRVYADGRKPRLFVGPGDKMVLLTERCDAVFVWRKFIDDSGQEGVNCALFRNEGPERASDLILEAERLAWGRFPGTRLYTYVDPEKITRHNERHRRNRPPGYCFIMAGWRKCGVSKAGQLIFEKLP